MAHETVVGREPLAGVTLDLLRNSDIGRRDDLAGDRRDDDRRGRTVVVGVTRSAVAGVLPRHRPLARAGDNKFGVHVSAKAIS